MHTNDCLWEQIQLKFINRYHDTWPAGITALSENAVLNLDALITHKFTLENAIEALELCADRSKGSVKVQIVDDTEVGSWDRKENTPNC